jgi:hypothetical protein
VTDTLLFLHLLSAAALFAAIMCVSASVLGAQLQPSVVRPFIVLSQVGLLGVLVFGLVLAIDIDQYDPWDVWVLLAVGLWLVAGGTGDRVARAYRDGGAQAAAVPAEVARAHWIHTAVVVLLLADMVWKPWA